MCNNNETKKWSDKSEEEIKKDINSIVKKINSNKLYSEEYLHLMSQVRMIIKASTDLDFVREIELIAVIKIEELEIKNNNCTYSVLKT